MNVIDERSQRPGCSLCSAFCHSSAGTCPPPQSRQCCASVPARCCLALPAQAPARAPHTRLSALKAAPWLLQDPSSMQIPGIGCPGLCQGMPGVMTFPQGAACKNVVWKRTQCKQVSTAHTPCRCAPTLSCVATSISSRALPATSASTASAPELAGCCTGISSCFSQTAAGSNVPAGAQEAMRGSHTNAQKMLWRSSPSSGVACPYKAVESSIAIWAPCHTQSMSFAEVCAGILRPLPP